MIVRPGPWPIPSRHEDRPSDVGVSAETGALPSLKVGFFRVLVNRGGGGYCSFMPIFRSIGRGAWAFCVIALLGATAPLEAETPPGFDPDEHMRVDEVRPGMKGYGMTVFRGTEVEPFRVTVVSVQHGFEPGQSVVWVRCPDPRMQKLGPVQGMSGSPIYLWDEGEADEHEPGEGGRMLGAFAFGHRLGKDCFVGVQPITQMLAAAARAEEDEEHDEDEGDGERPNQAAAGAVRENTLASSYRLARQLGLNEGETWRLDAISELAGYEPPAASEPLSSGGGPLADDRLALPVMVGSAQQANLLRPLFEPHGLAARSAPASSSSLPPDWIEPESVELKPGGVFAIPLVSGPMEMAAVGTVTEVLDDGTVLAFGHQFFAQGEIAVPMATGFVHFIQPNLSASFKLGGSVDVKGAVVRDETTAVVGEPGAQFPTVPVNVHVRWPNPALNADYTYRVVHHDRLLPALIGSVAGSSLVSNVELPQLNTVTVDARIRFEDGRTLEVNHAAPNGSAAKVMLAMMPAVGTLLKNPFGSAQVESVDATVRVQDSVEAAQIAEATLERSTVAPGDRVAVNVRIKPYREPARWERIELRVPDDAPEGDYTLTLGGAEIYQQLRMALRPHLMTARSEAGLFEAVQQILAIRGDALYAVLPLSPSDNLAIGRSELPNLPTSARALLAVESSTRTTAFIDSVEHIEPMPWVVLNHVTLPLKVEREDGE